MPFQMGLNRYPEEDAIYLQLRDAKYGGGQEVDNRRHIELGFKALKSLGWQWDQTRRTDPIRVSRHWLALSVATLLALAYSTRVEDAQNRSIAPGNLRTPPKALAAKHRDSRSRPARTVSVFRHGIDWLRRLRRWFAR